MDRKVCVGGGEAFRGDLNVGDKLHKWTGKLGLELGGGVEGASFRRSQKKSKIPVSFYF